MKMLQVHIEWPDGSETVDVEMDDDATEEEFEAVAKDTFFSSCNYGYSVDGEQR